VIHYRIDDARKEAKHADAIRRAFVRGKIHGLNLGWINHGRELADSTNEPIHGYGAECTKCRAIFGIIADIRDEYWICDECGCQNAAPLVAEENPMVEVKPKLRKQP